MSLKTALYGLDELSSVDKKILELTKQSQFSHICDENCYISPDYCINKTLESVDKFVRYLYLINEGQK